MANETTSITKLQEQTMKSVLVQSQLTRIKKEEEEELWISGEELYTEGSSDEEEYKSHSKSRRKINSNQSSRNPSLNSSERDHSVLSADSKLKLDLSTSDPVNSSKNSGKNANEISYKLLQSRTKHEQVSQQNFSLPLIESACTNRLSAVETPASSISKDSSDFSTEEEQMENAEISWKVKRELLLRNEEQYEDDWKDDSDDSSIDSVEDENLQKEILKVKNLDNLISSMNEKVKKAIDETLFYQCENRKKLEEILASGASETGKLAENTREFFHLCPNYKTLNADFHKNDKSYISPISQDCVDLLNLDNEIEWEHVGSDLNINAIEDSNSNPYIVSEELKKILLGEKETFQENLCNKEEVQLIKENYDNLSNTNDVISSLDTVSTLETLQDVDKDILNEVIMEVRLADPSSIVNVAEDKLDTRNR